MKKAKTSDGLLRLTLADAVRQFSVPKETLRRALQESGVDTERGGSFTVAAIHRALSGGDWKSERTRKLRAEADLLEFERREKEGELVDLAELQALIRDTHLPTSQRIRALPADIAHQCNPTDPQLAREALQRWTDDSLRIIRTALEKICAERAEVAP